MELAQPLSQVEQLICQHTKRVIKNSRNAKTEVQIVGLLALAGLLHSSIRELEADNAHNDQSAWLWAFLF